MAIFSEFPSYERLRWVVSRIHLATDDMISDLPINLLRFLRECVKQMHSQTALDTINGKIKLNLKAEQDLQKAKHLLKEEKREL